MYIYIYTHTYTYVYIYIYICICIIHRTLIMENSGTIRKGTNGVSTNGATANFRLFDRGTFWVLLFTCFYLPKSARACPFSPICKE